MTVTTQLKTVPRTVVGAYLRAARLPLTVAERIAKQQGNAQWPPALAFESVEAGVETVLGAFLKDDALVDKGRLRQAKVAQLRKAAELETVAEQARAEADQTFEQRREQAQVKRAAAERTAETREQQLEREARQREQAAEQKAAKKATAAREAAQAQEKAIRRQERVAKAEALSKESEALGAAKKAVDAEETVAVIEDTLDGTKEARKTG
jgi:flagellar biosynthesis GTPase FlhF